MIRVVILGSTGMLGWAVGRHFLSKPNAYDVHLSFRTQKLSWGSQKFQFDARIDEHISHIPQADYVINCIGCIKQRHYDTDTFTQVNSRFPHLLANECAKRNMRLIHPSTDCVFTGNKGQYSESDSPDAMDVYGISKIMGEPRKCMLLRTSIIGEELRTKYSLIEWAKAQRGRTIQGYTNHFWNGLTAIQYAKVCDQIIQDDLYVEELRHIYSTVVTKYEMLNTFNDHFDLKLNIEKFEHPSRIDRSLMSNYEYLTRKLLQIPSFEEMVKQL